MHAALAPWRAGPLLLAGADGRSPADVVRHFGAVQSQEHLMAPWAVARRTGGTLDETLAALHEGRVTRTHALRTTWHYVHLDDLPWIVASTGERVVGLTVAHMRRHQLAEADLMAGAETVTTFVRSSPGCDRAEIATALDDAGHRAAPGDVLAHVVMVAELRGEIAGWREPAGQHRYVPLDPLPAVDADTALATLARTYAHGHGPITPHDLAWWSSLTVRQSRRAIELAGLEPVPLDGRGLWSDGRPTETNPPPALLLPQFDESISYVRDAAVRAEVGPAYDAIMFGTGLLLLDGLVRGHWSRRVGRDTVEVEVMSATSLSPSARRAVEADAEMFAEFCGRALELAVHA